VTVKRNWIRLWKYPSLAPLIPLSPRELTSAAADLTPLYQQIVRNSTAEAGKRAGRQPVAASGDDWELW